MIGPFSFPGLTGAEATCQVFVVLFVLARSLLGEEGDLTAVSARVTSHVHSDAWWAIFKRQLSYLPRDVGEPRRLDQAVRATTAEEVRAALQLLPDIPPTLWKLCSVKHCPLSAHNLASRPYASWERPPRCPRCQLHSHHRC